MAESIDNFEDLEEFSLENCESDTFTKAANHVQKIFLKLDNENLLALYGLYKQGSEGPCTSKKPGFFDLKAKSKWEAWKKLGNMSKKEAKMLYIEKVTNLDPEFSVDNCEDSGSGWVRVSTFQNNEDSHPETLSDFVVEGNLEKLKQSLKSKEDFVNKLDDQGLGLIHWAADRGSVDALHLLLSLKADINLRDHENQTALHYAASCGHQHCVRFLLDMGADLHLKDVNGLEPFDVASDQQIQSLFK